ncbi:hypothetical protein, partial [Pseudoalteromonas xiamenensis]|uniref:hypothetical protein n=1 Tax=Pseudoalteromonas xiamenensis TaxID=882626 RepID=UPI001AD6AF99
HLPLKPLTALKLNQLLTRITGHPAYLHFDEVQGLLKGFIDLIFEWQGRYFVLDYKSTIWVTVLLTMILKIYKLR